MITCLLSIPYLREVTGRLKHSRYQHTRVQYQFTSSTNNIHQYGNIFIDDILGIMGTYFCPNADLKVPIFRTFGPFLHFNAFHVLYLYPAGKLIIRFISGPNKQAKSLETFGDFCV